MAVVDVATGKIDVFKDVPSDNSYYPSWTADGKQILFTTRPHDVWDLAVVNSDGTNFHVLKPGVQNEVTRYSPIWARDGQSVFCEDMTNIYQIGIDGAVLAQWKISKFVPKGDMSGDGRIDVSPDGKRLLLSIDMGEESRPQRLGWPITGALGVRSSIAKGDQAHTEKTLRLGRRLDRRQQYSFSQQSGRRKGRLDLSNVHRRKKSETLD